MMGQRGQRFGVDRRYRERKKRKGLCPRCVKRRPRGFVTCSICRRDCKLAKRRLTKTRISDNL